MSISNLSAASEEVAASSNEGDDISLMHCLRDGMKEIVEGKVSEDKPFEWFGGVDLQHPFKCEEGKPYSSDAHAVCYKKDNVYRK